MFCEKCGNEMNENALFCANCGAAVGAQASTPVGASVGGSVSSPVGASSGAGNIGVATTGAQLPLNRTIDRFGSFYGIGLMILAFVDYYSDPPVLTILLSIAIIAGAICCLARKYKLKGFTIAALLIAVFCLQAGVRQGNRLGYFRVPSYGNAQSVQTESGYLTEADNVADSAYGTVNDSVASGSASGSVGISPEFKKQVDDLEEFYNDYCDFMEEYSKAAAKGDVISMMDKYTKFVGDYAKYEAELNKLNDNQNNMTQEEMNYFLDAYNRIMKRLANVAYSVK